ncbi:MAG: hypothetical protein ACRD24_09615, partial [Terriglobales bacterium]
DSPNQNECCSATARSNCACTDGLWDHELAKWLGAIDSLVDLGALAREMVDAAKNASGKDNITAILARVNRVTSS